MYKITYIHKDETTENTLYDPEDQQYTLVSARLNLAMGQSGDLTVEVPESNPAYNDIVCLTDEIIIYRDGEELWRGRSVTLQTDFYRTGTLTCEGILSYLHDTYYHPFEFPFDGENGDPKILLQDIIDNHNAQVGDDTRKILTMGMVTVEDPNNYIARSSIYYLCTMEALQEKFINDSLGGYFRIRVEGDTRYLDYLENYNPNGETAEQAIEFGENLLNVAQELSYSDTASVILPLGAKIQDEEGLDTDEYTTIESVNGGSVYFVDEALVKEYGWICVSVTWDDVTLPSNLLEHARLYLAQVSGAVASFTVNAVDLALAGGGDKAWNVGDMIRIYSRPHDINQYAELTSMSLDLLNPEVDTYQFGGDTVSMTGSTRNAQRDLETSLGSLAVRLDNLSVNILNAVYANIEHLIADTITTEYIWAEVGELVTADIENLIADKANIEDLEAVYGSIDDLTVIVETVEGVLEATIGDFADLSAITAQVVTLLGGDITAGEITSIYLTADTTVIDTAVIANAVAGTVVAALLTADYIDTNLIHIGSEDGTLMIDDSTILICDADGNPRVQIGLDATGDYNIALWDSDGNCMFNAGGVTEYGINDGVIRDDMVADDAAIQGSKLDIASVAACLNADGSLILQASQVYIGDEGLSIVLAEMQSQIDSIDPSEYERYGICDVVDWFCLSDDGENPPDMPVDTRAYAEVFCLGVSILGTTETSGEWTTERLSADSEHYLWTVTEYICYDGTIIWGTARCMTDGYVRTATTTLLQEFEVMDGHVESLIAQVSTIEGDVEGITNDFNLFYQDYEQTINTISSSVELATENASYARETADNLVITVNEFQIAITDEVDILVGEYELIWSDVSYLYQSNTEIYQGLVHVEELIDGLETDGLLDFQVYYCLWDDDENPPDTEPYDDRAYAAVFCLGVSILGNTTSSSGWTTDRPTATDEMPYIWMRYRKVQVDGTVTWTEPTLWSDAYLIAQWSYIHEDLDDVKIQVGDISEAVSTIEVKVNNIKLTVTSTEDGSNAFIDLSVGDTVYEASVLPQGIRNAFADDNSIIHIGAGLVEFEAGTFLVSSRTFNITEDSVITSDNYTYTAGTIFTTMEAGKLTFSYRNSSLGTDDATMYMRIDEDYGVVLSIESERIYLRVPAQSLDDLPTNLVIAHRQIFMGGSSEDPRSTPGLEISGSVHQYQGSVLIGNGGDSDKYTLTLYWGSQIHNDITMITNDIKFQSMSGSTHGIYGQIANGDYSRMLGMQMDYILAVGSTDATTYIYSADRIAIGNSVWINSNDGLYVGSDSVIQAVWASGSMLGFGPQSESAQVYIWGSSIYLSSSTTINGRVYVGPNSLQAIFTSGNMLGFGNQDSPTEVYIWGNPVYINKDLRVTGDIYASGSINGTVSNASYADSAGTVTGTVNASQISGTVSNASNADYLTNPITVQISANGSTVSGSGTSTISVDITNLLSGSTVTEATHLTNGYMYVWLNENDYVQIGRNNYSNGVQVNGEYIFIGAESVTSNVYINASGTTMNGKLVVNSASDQITAYNTSSSGDVRVVARQNNDVAIYLGVGSGGYNRGIYDLHASRWLIYADGSNNTNINGNVYLQNGCNLIAKDSDGNGQVGLGSGSNNTQGESFGLYDASAGMYFCWKRGDEDKYYEFGVQDYGYTACVQGQTIRIGTNTNVSSNISIGRSDAGTIWIGASTAPSGGIGIGTTSKYTYIYGNLYLMRESDSNYVYVGNNSRRFLATSGNYIGIGNQDSPSTVNLYFWSNDIYFSSEPGWSSDRALKDDIIQLDKDEDTEKEMVASIDQLEPVSFHYKDSDDESVHYGYVAEDVQEVLPDLVTVNGMDGTLGLRYLGIIPLLHLKIKSLESRIAELESALPKTK